MINSIQDRDRDTIGCYSTMYEIRDQITQGKKSVWFTGQTLPTSLELEREKETSRTPFPSRSKTSPGRDWWTQDVRIYWTYDQSSSRGIPCVKMSSRPSVTDPGRTGCLEGVDRTYFQ